VVPKTRLQWSHVTDQTGVTRNQQTKDHVNSIAHLTINSQFTLMNFLIQNTQFTLKIMIRET